MLAFRVVMLVSNGAVLVPTLLAPRMLSVAALISVATSPSSVIRAPAVSETLPVRALTSPLNAMLSPRRSIVLAAFAATVS